MMHKLPGDLKTKLVNQLPLIVHRHHTTTATTTTSGANASSTAAATASTIPAGSFAMQTGRTDRRQLATCRRAKSTAWLTSGVGCGGFPERGHHTLYQASSACQLQKRHSYVLR